MAVSAVLTSCLLLMAVGAVKFLPSFDLGQGRALSLAPETANLLSRIDREVTITVHVGSQDSRARQIRALTDLYRQAAGGHLSFNYINPQTEAAAIDGSPRVISPDTARIEAADFRESISPVSEDALNGALTRLLHPERRVVYFLNTFGEKMVQDRGPGGLSQWADDLGHRRLLALDYYWPENGALPLAASVVVLAGPRAPLGEKREKLLLNYIKNGGKALIMVDPLVVAISSDFWIPFGLKIPNGLVVDPETSLAGTDEGFIVSHDYPAHPLTSGLISPIIWPLVGAFETLSDDGRASLPATTYAVAQSSPSSWLETDPDSFVNQANRYQPGTDVPGPLALAVAAELEGGGRLLALADSDLAGNGFRGFPGNRNFTAAALHWLLDGESVPMTMRDNTQGLILSHISARLTFWLPTVVWPALVLAIWFHYYRRRRWKRHHDRSIIEKFPKKS